jgi:hypothetical protein
MNRYALQILGIINLTILYIGLSLTWKTFNSDLGHFPVFGWDFFKSPLIQLTSSFYHAEVYPNMPLQEYIRHVLRSIGEAGLLVAIFITFFRILQWPKERNRKLFAISFPAVVLSSLLFLTQDNCPQDDYFMIYWGCLEPGFYVAGFSLVGFALLDFIELGPKYWPSRLERRVPLTNSQVAKTNTLALIAIIFAVMGFLETIFWIWKTSILSSLSIFDVDICQNIFLSFHNASWPYPCLYWVPIIDRFLVSIAALTLGTIGLGIIKARGEKGKEIAWVSLVISVITILTLAVSPIFLVR